MFDSGFNCAEAVLLALSEEFHQVTPVIPRIATGFGAGISRTGRICGALNGAIMAIGLRKGCDKAEEKEERNAIYLDVRKMLRAFRREFGCIECRELTKCDLQTSKGQENYRKQEIRKTLCSEFVRWCADYVAKKYK
ncbi:MAG TPA: C-GCAxxG-C-C family protein [Candidatus Bathyarchaeia archaeon]|nr:C-GCAxxG-C-C family protein [Candidatus Bathyarchaeia archaeon]